ncbi:Heparan sulfate glucosamine 3-O-sulfotransferase 3A1 [Dissostichus eleginoides]|uniref:Sulfotransferase n=1 Tax=Dissostichus eleginoides TaxID=100907 RepID=A0AAD9EY97_DISEL|nr:Heparan sulfate glucosamine 3-O-sulfotransferase 3A1 [Dissostichus eleginoides]
MSSPIAAAVSDNTSRIACQTKRELMPKTLEGQITMEKTPSYFVTREAPARISAMSRDTKLIVVVRDPVTRAISDYTQTLSKKPDIPSFGEPHLQKQDYGAHRHLVERHPDRHLRQAPGQLAALLPHGADPVCERRAPRGFPCLKKAEGSSKPHCLGKTKGRTHPNIDPEVVQRLRDFYRPFNMKFYQMTGHNFGWD